MKARPWIFTLKGKTLNFSCIVAPTFDAAAPSQQSPSQFHIATKTQTTTVGPQILASMTFSASLLQIEREIVPYDGNSKQGFRSLLLKPNDQIKK
jgi:hypothetical protein